MILLPNEHPLRPPQTPSSRLALPNASVSQQDAQTAQKQKSTAIPLPKQPNYGARAINEQKKKKKKPLTSPRHPISRGKQQPMPPCQHPPPQTATHKHPTADLQPSSIPRKTPGAPPDRLNFQHACRNIDAKRKQKKLPARTHKPALRARLPPLARFTMDPGQKKMGTTRPRFTGPLEEKQASAAERTKQQKTLFLWCRPPCWTLPR